MRNSLILSILFCLITILCKLIFSTQIMFAGFSPIIAIALFSGFTVKKDISFFFPFLSLLISDIVIEILNYLKLFPFHGFYHGQILNYILLLLVVLISSIKKDILSVSFIGPIFFFFLSNFSVWYVGSLEYSKDFNGIVECYIAGLPFLFNSIISTLFFLHGFVLLTNRTKNILLF